MVSIYQCTILIAPTILILSDPYFQLWRLMQTMLTQFIFGLFERKNNNDLWLSLSGLLEVVRMMTILIDLFRWETRTFLTAHNSHSLSGINNIPRCIRQTHPRTRVTSKRRAEWIKMEKLWRRPHTCRVFQYDWCDANPLLSPSIRNYHCTCAAAAVRFSSDSTFSLRGH